MEENTRRDTITEEMEEREKLENAKRDIITEEAEEGEKLTVSEREELEKLRAEKEKSLKEKLYDKVNVSVKTLDCIIFLLVVLFVIVVVMGILAGK